MKKLSVVLKNCYGIQSLEYVFDFDYLPTNPKKKAYAIYAPNGVMKTSFSRTFEALSNGNMPKEERYNRPSEYLIESDGSAITKETIFVLKAGVDASSESPAITNILVNPENKARYDELLTEIDKLKNKLIASLNKSSKIKKQELEQTILGDWNEVSFPVCIMKITEASTKDDMSPFVYQTIFDPKAVEVLKSQEFISKSKEFSERYQELFERAGTIYQKGVFNPAKAETSFSTLDKNGFFAGGHRVHLRGEAASIDKSELDRKLMEINASIDGDETLRKLRDSLAKNAQTQALTELIESLSSIQVGFLLEKLKPENQASFRKELWTYYIQTCADAATYLGLYATSKDEMDRIELAAAEAGPRWTAAVSRFNDRFVDMPFSLSIANQAQASLGKEKAKLKFTFTDGTDRVDWFREEVNKTLSQGERRALYLLYFIFEVEARKMTNQETLFILDDVADSFDYKNKHAIAQYLDDLGKIDFFYQIILTHNYDFFRTLANSFIHRDRCLMTSRSSTDIALTKAEGVKNYFIGKWKKNVDKNSSILCATIPFTRNIIEYTKGDSDPDYLMVTSLMHWKSDTDKITVGEYMVIYNRTFGSGHDTRSDRVLKDLLFETADSISTNAYRDGLILEDKVVLSIAIRMQAEIFLVQELRKITANPDYWCQDQNQFGCLLNEYLTLCSFPAAIRILEKVSITVSSNIHLNSFMYEPIIDLSIEHLVKLYEEVKALPE